jgi:hypothetical protein
MTDKPFLSRSPSEHLDAVGEALFNGRDPVELLLEERRLGVEEAGRVLGLAGAVLMGIARSPASTQIEALAAYVLHRAHDDPDEARELLVQIRDEFAVDPGNKDLAALLASVPIWPRGQRSLTR